MRYLKQPCRLLGTRYTPTPTHTDKEGVRYAVKEIPEKANAVGPLIITDISDLTALLVDAPKPAPAPRSVTPLQMRKALRATGLKEIVDAALAKSPETVSEEWEYATEILRDNATLDALAKALGKTDADLDALFTLAATF